MKATIVFVSIALALVVVLGVAGRAGVQDDVAAQRAVAQIVDDQRGMTLAHGPMVGG